MEQGYSFNFVKNVLSEQNILEAQTKSLLENGVCEGTLNEQSSSEEDPIFDDDDYQSSDDEAVRPSCRETLRMHLSASSSSETENEGMPQRKTRPSAFLSRKLRRYHDRDIQKLGGTLDRMIDHGPMPSEYGWNADTLICRGIAILSIAIRRRTQSKTDYVEVTPKQQERFEQPSMLIVLAVSMSYAILVLVGYLRDFLRKLGMGRSQAKTEDERMSNFVPLLVDFESFFTRNLYIRVRDCFNRPIASVPGAEMKLLDRVTEDFGWNFRDLGTTTSVINMGSYNYLGFAENQGPCSASAKKAILEYGVTVGASRQEVGTTKLQAELESLVAEFVGAEDAMCFPMGFATNSTNIPCLLGRGCLILSDELNHASLILGSRLSGASIRIFKHNDMEDLEEKLREAIIHGQPRTHRPYRKILICVEGVYSMEGSIVALPEVIALKKQYRAFLYLDEAHSIGALGKTGRGVCEYWGCNPKDVDILMGTFTKSFGSAGGYIAGSKPLIDYLRILSHSGCYGGSMSPPVIQQIITSMNIILGRDGSDDGRKRINRLARNSRYLRQMLVREGFIIYGNDNSPVVPMLTYFPALTSFLSRELLHHAIGAVAVGFPATPLTQARIRFCVSASHTKEMLDKVIEGLRRCSNDCFTLRFSRQKPRFMQIVY